MWVGEVNGLSTALGDFTICPTSKWWLGGELRGIFHHTACSFGAQPCMF